MNPIRVWAPSADQVDVVPVGASPRPLRRADGGWFELDPPLLPVGSDYHVVVDGGSPIPDPRSMWLPQGVLGPTRTVDHADFPWSDAGWCAPPLAAAVVYELHIGTFSARGTFRGAIDHLDHLVDLGITHVELMPVAAFSGEHGWGYDGVAWFAPHPAYGDPDDLKALVDACHRRGLAVLLDVVYNHLGPEGNVLPQVGPYLIEGALTPWGSAINLDGPHSDEVRRFIIDNALMWLGDYHVDGLRLDAVHALVDTSAVHVLEQLAVEVERLESHLGRHLVLIAESDRNDPRYVSDRSVGGYGIDAQWSDDFHHALHAALTGERTSYYADFGSLGDVADTLRHAYRFRGQYSAHRQRPHGRDPAGLPGSRFLGYLQTHDQVGNRSRGERSSELLSPDRLLVGAALVLTSPFVPMLFQGEEWASSSPFPYFADHQDPELAAAVRSGRLLEFASFGWSPDEVFDPEDHATFVAAKLRWPEQDAEPHARVLRWHQELIALRRGEPALTDGRLDLVEAVADDHACTLVVRRGELVIAANLGDPTSFELPGPAAVVLASRPADTELRGCALDLGRDAVAVLRLEPPR